MACENNEHRRPENYGGRGSRCPRYRGSPPEIISSGARGVRFFLDSPFNRTNIRLRWSREGNRGLRGLQTFGSAGAGRGRDLRVLQTFGSAGAGRGRDLRVLQTFGSAGAGREIEACVVYKHSAPLEPGGGETSAFYKHSAPLEPGGGRDLRGLQTFGSAGAGRGIEACAVYKDSAPLEPGVE